MKNAIKAKAHHAPAVKLKAVNEDGTFSGYGSVFNTVDSYREAVAPGAFLKSLNDWRSKGAWPALLWQHDSRQPIGVYTSMVEDDKGLRVEGRLLIDSVQQAQEAYALMRAGAVNGLSIGYACTKWQEDDEAGVTTLLEIDLWECSLVTFPANGDARVDTVKGLLSQGTLPTLSDFEGFLREAGFSKSQAKAIAGKGLSHLIQREAGSPSSEDLAGILALIRNH